MNFDVLIEIESVEIITILESEFLLEGRKAEVSVGWLCEIQ